MMTKECGCFLETSTKDNGIVESERLVISRDLSPSMYSMKMRLNCRIELAEA